MTRREMDKTLSKPLTERKKNGEIVFDWEDDSKVFKAITSEEAVKCFFDDDETILKCKTLFGSYFFGIGLEECEIIPFKKLKELFKNGKWYVYTLK